MNEKNWMRNGITHISIDICVEKWEEENNIPLTYTTFIEIKNHNLTKKPIKKLNKW